MFNLVHHLSAVFLVAGYPLCFLLESFYAYQPLPPDRWTHGRRNALVGAINLTALAAVGYGVWSLSGFGAKNDIGLVYRFTSRESWLAFFTLVLLYDCANYWIHRSLHRSRWLWPLHRAHHTDTYIDATSAFYFHPAEVFYRGAGQALFVLIVGISPPVLAAYQVWSAFALLLAHANLQVPRALEIPLRYVLVLPTTHRVHHSKFRGEHNSNFGIGSQIWDVVFGTFESADKQNQLRIGLEGYPQPLSLVQTLRDPLN